MKTRKDVVLKERRFKFIQGDSKNKKRKMTGYGNIAKTKQDGS